MSHTAVVFAGVIAFGILWLVANGPFFNEVRPAERIEGGAFDPPARVEGPIEFDQLSLREAYAIVGERRYFRVWLSSAEGDLLGCLSASVRT